MVGEDSEKILRTPKQVIASDPSSVVDRKIIAFMKLPPTAPSASSYDQMPRFIGETVILSFAAR